MSQPSAPASVAKECTRQNPNHLLPKTKPKPVDPIHSRYSTTFKRICLQDYAFAYDDSCLSPEVRAPVDDMPCFIDPYGGAKRRAMREKEEAERARLETEVKAKLEAQAISSAEETLEEDNIAAGSLALGGEPEDDPRSLFSTRSHWTTSQPLTDQFIDMNSEFSKLDASATSTIVSQQQSVQQAPLLKPSPATPLSTCPTLIDEDHSTAKLNMNRSIITNVTDRDISTMIQRVPLATAFKVNSNVLFQWRTRTSSWFTNGGNTTSEWRWNVCPWPELYQPWLWSLQRHNAEIYSIRNRSGTNQGHDIAKRELLLSLQNNPLRSPPLSAPAPGGLNTLYGQYQGAYQDPGLVKQRKKGKKHRHANTSSSGGGVEHLADPSIVQARAQQGNSTGQGLFGGNQGGYPQSNLCTAAAGTIGGHDDSSFDNVFIFCRPLFSSSFHLLLGFHVRRWSVQTFPFIAERSSNA